MPLTRISSRIASLVAVLFVLGFAGSARGADDTQKKVCAGAAIDGQKLRDEGKLGKAREKLLICAGDTCPAVLRKDCGEWLASLEAAQPSIVLGARDGGADVTTVKVDIDGETVTQALDGRPTKVDPGPHKVRFEMQGRPGIEQQIIIKAGEKNRAVSVDFSPAPTAKVDGPGTGPKDPSTSEGSSFRMPTAAWVLGGVGVAALGSFAAFGIMGKGELDNLRATCGTSGSCTPGQVDGVKTKLLVADISLGVGVAALATTAIVVIVANRSKPSAQSRAIPLGFRF